MTATSYTLPNNELGPPNEIEILTSCRDHWKTSFEHERANVIRLRQLLHQCHGKACCCPDCELVKFYDDTESRRPLAD